MKNTPEIGKIYDTIFFGIEYFNEDAVKKAITNNFTDSSFMDECYRDVKEKIFALPPILAPIFLYHDQTPTAITAFFDEQINFETDTIDTFLKKITSKSGILYSKIIESVFKNNQNLDNKIIAPIIAPDAYVEALSESNYSENFKLQVSLLFGNFNYAISVLTQKLQEIYVQVDMLHQKYADSLSVETQQIQSERNLQLYKQLYSIDIASYHDNAFASISLLNQYISKIISKDNNIELLFGFKHEEDLNRYFDEQNIDLRQLLIAVGNDTRLSILQTLMEKEELTASSIAKIIEIPTTTVLRHVEILYNCGAIYISKRSGLQIFYRINFNLLTHANKLISYKLGGKAND